MAAAVAQPVSAIRDEHVMDTRTSSPSPDKRSNSGSEAQNASVDGEYKPDLSNEVSMLSTKLINAINHQTNLDDTLQHTRHELDWANQEVKRLRAEKQSLDDAIAQGVLVKKSEVDKTISMLRAELAKENASRESAEKAKRETDRELEDLTANLFDEANKMVAEARRDTDAVERRNSQLRSQLNDTEVLLASQQEQLQDLKLTMEKLERVDTSVRDSSVPTTPINSATAVFDAMYTSPSALGNAPDIPPDHPLHFSQLIAPILRTDVAAYTDFAELLAWARRGAPHSRSASGNVASASQTNLSSMYTAAAAATSSPNLPGAFSFGSSSANSSPSSSTFNGTYVLAPPLKESKFYKRVLIEDLEPTLRLDLAPGLSFLSRRTVTSSLLNGTLAVEPFTPPTKFYSPIFACALCGESRKAEPYVRRHRFRTSESDDAQRYPLCEFCLGRIRAAADFVGFLRMVRDGHWRCGNEEEEKSAWEEAVRLRERMFWARIGGGVVPAGVLQRHNAAAGEGRKSLESIPESRTNTMTDGHVDGAEGEDSEDAAQQQEQDDDGIGRAIVNMASRAASSAVPELKPQERDSATEPMALEDSEEEPFEARRDAEKRRTILHTPDQQPQQQLERADSQQEQAEAEAQLRRESEASEVGIEEMQTPPETREDVEILPRPTKVDQPAPPQSPVSAAAVAEASSFPDAETEPNAETQPPKPAPQPELEQPNERPRPSRESSSTSQRNLSPPKPPSRGRSTPMTAAAAGEERRPSSVLDRVRAMEAKGGK